MKLFILFIICCAITDASASKTLTWRAVFLDSFTVHKTFSTSTEMFCAILASRVDGVRLYKYNANLCEVSTEVKIPSTTELSGSFLCKTNVSPFEFCLHSNGTLIESGTIWAEANCKMVTHCSNGKLVNDTNYASTCPPTFLSKPRGCIKFITTAATMCEARKQCKLMGADLASPDLGDVQAIEDIATYEGMPKMVYIALMQEAYEAPFVLVSDPAQPEIPTNAAVWESGQPNGTPTDHQFCVVLMRDSKRLQDKSCSTVTNYICEVRGFRN